MGSAFETMRQLRREPKSKVVLFAVGYAAPRPRIVGIMRQQGTRQNRRWRRRDFVINGGERPRDERSGEARSEILRRAYTADGTNARLMVASREHEPP